MCEAGYRPPRHYSLTLPIPVCFYLAWARMYRPCNGWDVVEYVGFLEELVDQVCPHVPSADCSLDFNG